MESIVLYDILEWVTLFSLYFIPSYMSSMIYVIIIKTKVPLPQAWVTLSDCGYSV